MYVVNDLAVKTTDYCLVDLRLIVLEYVVSIYDFTLLLCQSIRFPFATAKY